MLSSVMRQQPKSKRSEVTNGDRVGNHAPERPAPGSPPTSDPSAGRSSILGLHLDGAGLLAIQLPRPLAAQAVSAILHILAEMSLADFDVLAAPLPAQPGPPRRRRPIPPPSASFRSTQPRRQYR